MIVDVDKRVYPELIAIWQAAVLVSHFFLDDAEIERLKQLILNTYFDAVALKGITNKNNQLVGFIGTNKDTIEMLFIDPCSHGQGYGAKLCQYAINDLGTTQVDVNEQNPKAIKFYQKMGFEVIARSAIDNEGKPYPILHMQIS